MYIYVCVCVCVCVCVYIYIYIYISFLGSNLIWMRSTQPDARPKPGSP